MAARRGPRSTTPARFWAVLRPDGQWAVLDRHTGVVPVGDKAKPVRQAAIGYAAWLNRTDREGKLGPDYRPTWPPTDRHYPDGATGAAIDRIWRWRAGRRRAP
jgi:hypothetical protein